MPRKGFPRTLGISAVVGIELNADVGRSMGSSTKKGVMQETLLEEEWPCQQLNWSQTQTGDLLSRAMASRQLARP